MKLHVVGLGIGVLLGLTACGHPNNGQMSEESYFPPLGLGQEAVALEQRREPIRKSIQAPTARAPIQPIANEAVPLDQVVCDEPSNAVAAPQATLPVGGGNIGTARTIMTSLCITNAGNLTNLRPATTAINQRLFGTPPPIDLAEYTLGGKQLGAVAPIRFTPRYSTKTRRYGCGVAVRGEDPNQVAQALFADLAAAGLTPIRAASAGNGSRTYQVTGGRPDLGLVVTTRRSAGKPLINFVLTHE